MANTKVTSAVIADGAITPSKIASGDFYFDTDTLYIDSTNNRVGIGVTNPATTLGINGATQILAGNALYFQNSAADANGTISGSGGAGENTLSFNSGAMVLNASGNVGIGTSSPSYILDVNGAASEVGKFKRSTAGTTEVLIDTSGSGDARLVFADNGTDSYAIGRDNTNGDFVIAASGALGTSNLINIEAGGNVGIGTNSPAYILDVVDTTGNAYISSGRGTQSQGEVGFKLEGGTSGGDWYIYQPTSSNDLRFYQGSDKVTIDTSGKVGIGTSSPTYNLSVENSSGNVYIQAKRASQSQGQVALELSGGTSGTNWVMYQPISSNDLRIFGNSGDRMTITSSGNVGIGTASPSQKLDVVGKIVASEGITTFSGDPTNYGMFRSGTTMQYKSAGAIVIESGSNSDVGIYANGGYGRGFFRNNGNVELAWDGSNETGYMYAGKGWSATNHRINLQVTAGNNILVISSYAASGVTVDTAIFKSCNSGGASTSACGLQIQRNGTTARSINAGGTINASGSDYAEYMLKNSDFDIEKGDICGVDANGKLTNKYSEAHSFVVKSTDPSYVGGDVWGSEEVLGNEPKLTIQEDDETDEEYETRKVEYESEKATYEAALEAARQPYDRIAFSGQVPVNVTEASVGDYILAKEGSSDSIVGEAVSNPTFEQYQLAVGKVWKILEDGRAFISVKIG